jgi:hypothetical protein
VAFFTDPILSTSKVDAAQAATSGRKMHTIPATSPALSNSSDIIPPCVGCAQEGAHDVCRAIAYDVPWNEHRYERVTQSGRPDRAEFNRLQSALFILGHIGNGVIGDEILFNAGAANNGSQFVEYEIVSASGTTQVWRGPNPKRIGIGVSRINPNWPFDDDPITGDPARIQTDTIHIALPVGSEVEFLAPSVLRGKVRPWIKSISVPGSSALNDVTFSVTLSSSATNADVPYDDGVVDADHVYRCRVRFELAQPATWANVQSPRERAWTKRTQVLTSAANTALTNGTGNTRILWPDMGVNVQLFTAKVVLNDATEYILNPFETVGGNPRLVTTQSGGGWTTTFNVSDLTFGANPEDVDEVQVTFFHQAVDGTGLFVHHTSQCANSQREISGSYVHDSGHRCMAVDSSGFGNYQRECWQPGGCDRFSLGDSVSNYGPLPALLVSDYGSANWWSAFWHRESWVLEQLFAGDSRNFDLARPLGNRGPSIASLCGAWLNQVPDGKFARRIPWFAPVWGRRHTWTDDGDQFQMLVHGAFFEEGFIDDAIRFWNASGNPGSGVIASEVTGWDTKVNATGDSMRATLRNLPWRYTGGVNLYTYSHSGDSLGLTNIRQTGSETFITNANMTVVDGALNPQIQAAYG